MSGLNSGDVAAIGPPPLQVRLRCDQSFVERTGTRNGPPPHSFGGTRQTKAGATYRSVTAFMQIIVRDNNVDQALRALKKKLQREGVYREMKLRRHYEKPSEKRARERAAAIRRSRKLDRKRAERDGAR